MGDMTSHTLPAVNRPAGRIKNLLTDRHQGGGHSGDLPAEATRGNKGAPRLWL
jgi:hypothetical protein